MGLLVNEKVKLPRDSHLKTSSVVSQSYSKQLDIPDSIARKRRKLIFDHAERINAKSCDRESFKWKAALDSMWCTLINSASAHQMRLYMEKSPLVLTKVIPSIVNEAVVKI